MSKIQTPAMEKAAKRASKRKHASASPMVTAVRRLARNKLAMIGFAIFVLYLIVLIVPGLFTNQSYEQQDYSNVFASPGKEHLMGTDNLGRDIFTRIIYATRVSLGIGIMAVAVSLFVGGTFGAVAAFYGGRVDDIIMRFIDVLQSIPGMLLAISIATALGKTVFNLLLAMGISTIPPYAKVVRASVLTAKDRQFIEAGKCLGADDSWLILKHMIPNSLGPIIVQTTFGIAAAILSISALSYIGLGVQPPTPEWGSMLSSGKQYLQQSSAWTMTVMPGLAILFISFALNVLGDGLRDAFDPRLK